MRLFIVLVAGTALALTACGKSASPDIAANEAAAPAKVAETETASPAPAAPAAAGTGTAPTREYLLGKWALMDDDCSLTVEYKADGTLLGPQGQTFDRWQLDGAELTLASNPGKLILSVVDQNHMETRREGESESKRIARC